MSGEAWLYLFAVIINAVNLFLQVFFTIMYSDLEWYGPPGHATRIGRVGMKAGPGEAEQHRQSVAWLCYVMGPAALRSSSPC
jgi:hypothetical protein